MTEHGPPSDGGSFPRGHEGPWPPWGFPWRDALRRNLLQLSGLLESVFIRPYNLKFDRFGA